MYDDRDLQNGMNLLSSSALPIASLIISCLVLVAIALAIYSVTVYIPKRLDQIEKRIKGLEKKEK